MDDTGAPFSRRQALMFLSAAGASSIAGCPDSATLTGDSSANANANTGDVTNGNASITGVCVVTPSETEGPYFVDELLNRADVRSDPESGTVEDGVLLRLRLTVHRVDGNVCSPLEGAIVDIWHCNAEGLYSDVSANRTVGQKFLRGYQTTDADGVVEFSTIYPGWYSGRTVHIHFKVRTLSGTRTTFEFTSQLFFDEAITSEVYQQTPYSTRGEPDTSNARDGIFRSATLLTLERDGDGWLGGFDIGLQMT